MSSAITALTPEVTALRGIRSSEIKVSGKVRKSAFMPRRNGRDRDGLSVSIETRALVQFHRSKFVREGHRACQIRVAAVRELSLDVIRNATEDDPAHALITGIPDVTEGQENLAKVEHLAAQLAKSASGYEFPVDQSQ